MSTNVSCEKMLILAFADSKSAETGGTNDAKDRFEALINPESYTLEYKVKTSDGQGQGTSGAQIKFEYILPEELTFIHAEDILDMFPDLPRKQRETEIIQKYPAVFIYGIGWPLKDGYPHEMRAADYDDWATETVSEAGKPMHGLNGDILVWNPITKRRHELTSMGIRVTPETLKTQLEMAGQLDFLKLPYHQAIMNNEIPLSIGGGIGQSRTFMLLLKKAHIGEVSVTVWPKILKEMCAQKNIHVLE